MIIQGYLFKKEPVPSDVVYTPLPISAGILRFLNPSGKLLDPCKGDGSFYNQMPIGSDYCELQEGSDFFDYNKKVDWVIGNPPYSIFDKFLEKSFEISDNVSFLVPTNKVFQRQIIMDRISKWGGVKSIIVYGSGTLIGFPFGFSVGNFHFKKDFKGQTQIIMGINQIKNL